MDLKERLNELKRKGLANIGEALKKNDTDSIYWNTEIVKEAEQLISRLENFEKEIDQLEEKSKGSKSADNEGVRVIRFKRKAQKLDETISPRIRGATRRNEFIEKLKSMNIELLQKGGSQFETYSGDLVGIAYASEHNPDHWFLGLPIRDYHSLVFICENEKEEVTHFILPPQIYQMYKSNFSTSGKHYKFNIHLRAGNYRLNIPGIGHLSLNEYRDKFSF